MNKEKELQKRIADLRQKAENQMKKTMMLLSEKSFQDLHALVQELQIHQIELTLQNDELLKFQKLLEKMRKKYFALYDAAPVGYCTLDRYGNIREVNMTEAKQLGVEKNSLLNKNIYHFIIEEDRDKYFLHLRKVFKTVTRQVCEVRLVKNDGIQFYGHLESVVSDNTEDGLCLTAIIDITERKEMEERLKDALKDALKERETLLREINHRVKNNFSAMTSLLSLRAQATDNPSFREAMQECISQIRAISLIHERLYGIGNLSEIDFGEVICKITEELFHIYNTDNLQISPIVYSDKVLLTAYHAIPCAFILNELVSNSLKHAFPNKRSGEVCIELREKDGLVTLIVSDNGVGIPEDHDVMAGRSLGMKLTMTFIQQIQGTYKLDRSNGTKVIITFPKK